MKSLRLSWQSFFVVLFCTSMCCIYENFACDPLKCAIFSLLVILVTNERPLMNQLCVCFFLHTFKRNQVKQTWAWRKFIHHFACCTVSEYYWRMWTIQICGCICYWKWFVLNFPTELKPKQNKNIPTVSQSVFKAYSWIEIHNVFAIYHSHFSKIKLFYNWMQFVEFFTKMFKEKT